MKNLFLFTFLLVLYACNSSSNPVDPKLNEEFELKYGQTVHIQDLDLTINFDSVIADSRCPQDAVCRWEGDAEISLIINEANMKVNTTLQPSEIEISNYLIQLISLSPYPKINEEINQEDYEIKLIVVNL